MFLGEVGRGGRGRVAGGRKRLPQSPLLIQKGERNATAQTLLSQKIVFRICFFFHVSIWCFFTSLCSDENPSGFRSKPLNFVVDPRDVEILQSWNGLLMYCSSFSTISKYYIVNSISKSRLVAYWLRMIISRVVDFNPSSVTSGGKQGPD